MCGMPDSVNDNAPSPEKEWVLKCRHNFWGCVKHRQCLRCGVLFADLEKMKEGVFREAMEADLEKNLYGSGGEE